jgi:hypothetical protein
MPTTLAPPNAELVAQAWLADFTGIPAGQIAGSLPKDPDPLPPIGERSKLWKTFLTTRLLTSGSVQNDVTERRTSILQLDAWARNGNGSVKQPWGAAMTMLERVRAQTFRDAWATWCGKPILMPVSGYASARVLGVYLTREPTRVESDPSAYARMTCDLAVDWTA